MFKTMLASGGRGLIDLYFVSSSEDEYRLCSRRTMLFEGLKAMFLNHKMDNIEKCCKDLITR